MGGATPPPVPPRKAQAASIRPAGAATAATEDAGPAPAAWRLRGTAARQRGAAERLIAVREVAAAVARCGTASLRWVRWAYATTILHASAASTGAEHRRVLQVNYAATDLPDGLLWLGV